jgi:D-methionine transport system substrate-binding protein
MSGTAAAPQLPQKQKKNRTPLIVTAIVVVVAIIAAIVIGVSVANANGAPKAGATAHQYKPTTVSIGVSDAAQPYWKIYSDLAKKKLNVTVKLVNFSSYTEPNPALAQKQIDLNSFQHIEFLAVYNVTNHQDLQPIGATVTVPLPLYSTKYTSVKDLPDGATVAIPNDQVNQARGLLVLQSAGLLKLKDGGTAFSTINDITSKKVTISTVSADQTARALQSGSVDAAIVNNNFATQAGLPTSARIAKDDPKSDAARNYVNFFAARKADAKNPLYLKLAALYHDKAVEASELQSSGGTAVFSDATPKELQAQLKQTEADARAAGVGK